MNSSELTVDMSGAEKRSSVIFFALLVGQVVFLLAATMVERSVPPPESTSAETLLIVCIVLVLPLWAASFYVGRMLMENALRFPTEAERISGAMRAIIVRLALLEAGGVLSIVCFLLTGENTFLGILGLVLISFVLRRPTSTEWEMIRRGVG